MPVRSGDGLRLQRGEVLKPDGSRGMVRRWDASWRLASPVDFLKRKCPAKASVSRGVGSSRGGWTGPRTSGWGVAKGSGVAKARVGSSLTVWKHEGWGRPLQGIRADRGPTYPMLVEVVSGLGKGETPELHGSTQHTFLPVPSPPCADIMMRLCDGGGGWRAVWEDRRVARRCPAVGLVRVCSSGSRAPMRQ